MAARSKPELESRTPELREPDDRGQLLRALGAGLTEVVAGLEVLDRDLVLDSGGRADLAGVDGAGRLVLALVADDDADRGALEALDTLASATRQAGVLARHLGSARLRLELEPRVIVVSPGDGERLALRLAPLLGRGIELFGVRSVRSAAGERSYLVSLLPPPQPALEVRADPEEAFVRLLPRGEQELALALVRRMDRLDEEVEASANRSSVSWRFQGEVLARLEKVGDGLLALVSPHEEPVPLRALRDVDRVVEGALARLVQLLGPTSAPEPARQGQEAHTPPLLTPEELEAFRT